MTDRNEWEQAGTADEAEKRDLPPAVARAIGERPAPRPSARLTAAVREAARRRLESADKQAPGAAPRRRARIQPVVWRVVLAAAAVALIAVGASVWWQGRHGEGPAPAPAPPRLVQVTPLPPERPLRSVPVPESVLLDRAWEWRTASTRMRLIGVRDAEPFAFAPRAAPVYDSRMERVYHGSRRLRDEAHIELTGYQE